ncbi:MAG: beta-eliminating lyase-related protein [Hyphomicrobiales bacterium]
MFASDNWAGACPQVQHALAQMGAEVSPAYGGDEMTQTLDAKLSEVFETPVHSLITATGSAANALALSAYAKPAGITLAHKSAHITVDEYNGPERVNPGLKILALTGHAGKLTADELNTTLALFPDGEARQGRLTCLSVTQATELGQVYTVEELKALSAPAKALGLGVHMDGARFANALAFLKCHPADITWKSGVDCLSLGFTKNGAWCADLLIFFAESKVKDVGFVRKQVGQNFSKPKFIAAQVLAMLNNDTWLKNAKSANHQALFLANGLVASGKSQVPLAPQANEVFAYFSSSDIERLQGNGASFYPWPEDDIPVELREENKTLVRLVCSFATSSREIDLFLRALG